MSKKKFHWRLCASMLAVYAICTGCNAEEWPIASVVDLVVNIEDYTKFQDFAPRVPDLLDTSDFWEKSTPVDTSSVPKGKHSYTAVDVRSDLENFKFIVYVQFVGDRLRVVHIGGSGPIAEVEVFMKKFVEGINRKHRYSSSYIASTTHRQDTIRYPVLEWKSDRYIFLLRLIPALEWSNKSFIPPSPSIAIEENSPDARGFPRVETTVEEKREIFDKSGLSRILAELNIDLQVEAEPQEPEN